MKRFYKIDTYMKNGAHYELTKTNLHTAFYCLRDCINSGLYCKIFFAVYEKDATNKYLLNEKLSFRAGDGFIQWNNTANWYFERFKSFIRKYGTSKEINFKKGV